MATGFPATTGDIFTAADYNGLVTFEVKADQTADYTIVLADSYQMLIPMNKATAVNLSIPTNATAAIPVGSVITVLNKGAGAVTIKAVKMSPVVAGKPVAMIYLLVSHYGLSDYTVSR